jgi:hypothetical protein
MVEITENIAKDIIGEGSVTDIGDKTYYISYKWRHRRGCAVFKAIPLHVDVDIEPSFEHIGVYIAYPAKEEYIESVLSGDIRYKNDIDSYFFDWEACYDVDKPQIWSELS